MYWRGKWQPTPVFLPGEPQGRGSLVGCRLWGCRVGHDCSDLAAAAAGRALDLLWADMLFLVISNFLTSEILKASAFSDAISQILKTQASVHHMSGAAVFFTVLSYRIKKNNLFLYDLR